jgi:hypothetical protein
VDLPGLASYGASRMIDHEEARRSATEDRIRERRRMGRARVIAAAAWLPILLGAALANFSDGIVSFVGLIVAAAALIIQLVAGVQMLLLGRHGRGAVSPT